MAVTTGLHPERVLTGVSGHPPPQGAAPAAARLPPMPGACLQLCKVAAHLVSPVTKDTPNTHTMRTSKPAPAVPALALT